MTRVVTHPSHLGKRTFAPDNSPGHLPFLKRRVGHLLLPEKRGADICPFLKKSGQTFAPPEKRVDGHLTFPKT